jgi:hypothetical protein
MQGYSAGPLSKSIKRLMPALGLLTGAEADPNAGPAIRLSGAILADRLPHVDLCRVLCPRAFGAVTDPDAGRGGTYRQDFSTRTVIKLGLAETLHTADSGLCDGHCTRCISFVTKPPGRSGSGLEVQGRDQFFELLFLDGLRSKRQAASSESSHLLGGRVRQLIFDAVERHRQVGPRLSPSCAAGVAAVAAGSSAGFEVGCCAKTALDAVSR